jgi:hypothetical protein
MGPALIILAACFVAWTSISIIRRGYYVGRNHFTATGSKRYYRAGHALSFWAITISGLVLAIVLIGWTLSRLYWG